MAGLTSKEGGRRQVTKKELCRLLKGAVLINNSSLVFPPTSGVTAMESQLSVPMVLVNDTTREVQNGGQTAAERYFGQRGPAAQRGTAGAENSSPSFMDGLRYDLARTYERVSAPKALDQYKRILQVSINYKDVSERVSALEKAAVDSAGESPPDVPA